MDGKIPSFKKNPGFSAGPPRASTGPGANIFTGPPHFRFDFDFDYFPSAYFCTQGLNTDAREWTFTWKFCYAWIFISCNVGSFTCKSAMGILHGTSVFTLIRKSDCSYNFPHLENGSDLGPSAFEASNLTPRLPRLGWYLWLRLLIISI